MLSKDQIQFYHENGYLGVESVYSDAEVAALRRVTDEFVEASRAHAEHTDVFDLEPTHTPENPRLRRLKNPVQQHEIYDQALRNGAVLDIVEQLVGKGVRTNGNKLNLKYADFGSPVEWHQDWAFYPHTNDDLLAVGVAIDPMTEENGCLKVIPGSHRDRIYDHHHSNGFFVGAVTESDFNIDGAVPIIVGAGGISIHHARVLHGSQPNMSPNPRRLLLFQYCAVDAWPLTGVSDWDAFNGNILRGEPTFAPRLAEVPVRVPLPSGERGGSIYETQAMMEDRMYDVVQ